jgi:uncharacterized protein (TIGR02757 family)
LTPYCNFNKFVKMNNTEIPIETISYLRRLADKYEISCFCDDDPSCILSKYKSAADTETAAFIMSVLSFGRRDLFMKKAAGIFSLTNCHPAQWIRSCAWEKQFPQGNRKFYRFYSYDDMRSVFASLQKILSEEKTVGAFIRRRYETACAETGCSHIELAPVVSGAFSGCRAVSHTAQSANKRVNMFLRWMVRTNSPVDSGLWTWYSPADLIIPLDTHVLRQAVKLGLISAKSAGTAKTARELTNALKQIWPADPCRGDFALFGLGIDGNGK